MGSFKAVVEAPNVKPPPAPQPVPSDDVRVSLIPDPVPFGDAPVASNPAPLSPEADPSQFLVSRNQFIGLPDEESDETVAKSVDPHGNITLF